MGGRRERLWGNGIVTAGILPLTVLSFVKNCFVTVNDSEQPIRKKIIFSITPNLSR